MCSELQIYSRQNYLFLPQQNYEPLQPQECLGLAREIKIFVADWQKNESILHLLQSTNISSLLQEQFAQLLAQNFPWLSKCSCACTIALLNLWYQQKCCLHIYIQMNDMVSLRSSFQKTWLLQGLMFIHFSALLEHSFKCFVHL